MARLGKENIVFKLSPILLEDALLHVSHRIGAAQADLLAIEEYLPLRLAAFVDAEGTHAELLHARVESPALFVEQNGLQLVEPRTARRPRAGTRHVEAETQVVHSRSHRPGGFEGSISKDNGIKILPENGETDLDVRAESAAVPDLKPCLRRLPVRNGAHEDIVDVDRAARLDENILAYAHPGRTVMPAHSGVVIAQAGSRIDLVTFVKVAVLAPTGVAHADGIILDFDRQSILSSSNVGRDVKLERGEEALM